MKQFLYLLTLISLSFSSCSISPKPIAYGSDGCHFCSMTIVDKQHAAEFVTKKGRSYKFDASECMLNYLKGIDKESVALFLVNDYDAPGEFIDATKATYLISNNIPSPMGAFLTAFETLEAAENVKSINKGELFTWKLLQERFK
ncbi:nitrous oxide reductase accessory protein NosL [Maribacter sp. ACAM166]|uniref:nitrous oxide reductase accessory protein NosL n=1 Tax=Maribacter sp. ACAM166 TaxID=2508996 RepID=UPI0010FE223B|nr:nitrous oxide reductase accessory protein NosL [Maribacter sp. ACAM166]TLP80183.1 hypothetical protein ES765_09415 [Maribacter sp. ACAM166]